MRSFYLLSFLVSLFFVCPISPGKAGVPTAKVVIQSPDPPADPRTVPESDSLALVALYNATNGANWKIKTNWLTGKVNTWSDVTVEGGRVTSVYLANNQLSGSIPFELGDLTNLETLNLSFNQLSGSIPASLGNLPVLRELSLYDNQLSGHIPVELGKLTTLHWLILSGNQLSGSIPVELGKLANLTFFILPYNQLSGSIPAELGNLTNMTVLNLASNQLSGDIPASLGNLTALETLDLANNQFSSLPPFIAILTNGLYAEKNQLTFESLEPNVSKFHVEADYSPQDSVGLAANLSLTAWQPLQLSALVGGANNKYQWTKDGADISGATNATLSVTAIGAYGCKITNTVVTGLTLNRRRVNVSLGTHPVSESDSLALVALYNSTNGANWTNNTDWLTGKVDTWYGVTVNGGKVTGLHLYGNQLIGSLPSELGNLTALQDLYLDNNQLNGSIPASMGKLTALRDLILLDNELSGSLPSELGSLTALQHLRLDNNQLSGNLPGTLGNMTSLEQIVLSNNQVSGSLPSELGNLSTLQELALNNNQLSGSLPTSLGNLSALRFLGLSDNQLSGAIPASLGNISVLTWLYLDNNQFSSLPSFMDSLTDLSVSQNQLTFESLEGNISKFKAEINYTPQDSVGVGGDQSFTFGQSLSLSALVGGANNKYQWTLNEADISGATNATLTVTAAGVYSCKITNTVVPGLTLHRRRVRVHVNKAVQTITFAALPNKTVGDAAFTLMATASSGLPVSFSIVSGPATLSGTTLTLTGSGLVKVKASQAGNENYQAALAVEQAFTVTVPVILATEVILSSEVAVFPNPTSGLVKVTLPAMVGIAELVVWNAQGQAVLEQKVNGQESAELNLSSLPAGLYLLQIKGKLQPFFQRILKQ
ncbi:MAG: leucine-rich repeat domain-containing protein [Bacteroidota bacterium]